MIAARAISLCLLFAFPLLSFSQESEIKHFNARWDTLTVQEREVPGEAIRRLRQDEDFWWLDSNNKQHSSSVILNKKERKRKDGEKGQEGRNRKDGQQYEAVEDEYKPVTSRPWFQAVLWFIILGGFATFLAIYLAGSNIGLFRKKNRVLGKPEESGPMPEDIFAINYQKEIDKAVQDANYRLAVRLHFLRLLKNMADRSLIHYKQDKTNFEYLTEVAAKNFYSSFFRATRNYEYSWYGLFPVSNEAYQTIKKDFDKLEQELK